MDDLGIIDRFMEVFGRYIDSGFGLLSGDVGFLTSILIGIDITLAGLFWALGGEDNILARLIRKVLYVGTFALILNNFQTLTGIIYASFAGLGVQTVPGGLTADDLLRPGKIAATGYEAAWPLIAQVGNLVGIPDLFVNALTIFVLLLAWFLVIIAFFILSIQLFITVLEFKLTALAGFVLVPFALWNKTAFLAERVLGNVISSGVKVMVLAVIVGIGSTLFTSFTDALQGQEPDMAAAMSMVLGALALLGLGIFGPGIASGLVSGAPQLGAGAALGTVGAAAGATLLVGGAALSGVGAVAGGSLVALRAATALGAGVTTSFQVGRAASGASGLAGTAAGMGGVARAASGKASQTVRSVSDRAVKTLKLEAKKGRAAAWTATGGAPAGSASFHPANSNRATAPDWARRLRHEQNMRAHRHSTTQAVRDGDRPGAGANPSLDEKGE